MRARRVCVAEGQENAGEKCPAITAAYALQNDGKTRNHLRQ
jgi:hypothetical protein